MAETILKINDKTYLFFYGGYLSNFYTSHFKVNNVKFNTVEQYFHYHKAVLFNDDKIQKKILETFNPSEQKRLGRLIDNYDDQEWNKVSYKVMKEGLMCKFSQNPILKKKLLAQNVIFVEASPYDCKWGIGMSVKNQNLNNLSKWRGSNLLGKALNEIKDELIQY